MRKKLLIFSVISVLITVISGCAKAAPKIEAVDEPWSFGEIEKGVLATKAFSIRNAGDSELVINRVQACCGYGVGNLSLWNIKPGEKAELTILSDTSLKPLGEDQRTVTVFSNDPAVPDLKIAVTTTIIPAKQDVESAAPAVSAEELPSEGREKAEEDISEEVSDEITAGESE